MKRKKSKISSMEFTGERMVLGTNNYELEIEHLNRYYFGAQFVKDKRVLDAACGTGYGSAILAENAAFVEGIDISREAIDYAIDNYSNHNISFTQASVDKLPYPDNNFDVVISFETIEHLDGEAQINFLFEIKRVLLDDGILVISTPNHDIYKEKGENQFHIKELNYMEFNQLLLDYFKKVHFFSQEFEICNVIANTHDNNSIINCEITPERSEYLIALCSQTAIENVISRVIMRNNQKLRNLINWAVENHKINTNNNEYIETQTIKIEHQQRTIEGQSVTIGDQQRTIEGQSVTIEHQQRTIEDQSQNIERILTKLAIKDRYIEHILGHEKTVILRATSSVEKISVELQQALVTFAQSLSQLEKENEILLHKLSESQENLAAIQYSTCWKITKPMRMLGDFLRAIKRSLSLILKPLPVLTDDHDRSIEDVTIQVPNLEDSIKNQSKILVVDFRIPMYDVSAGELATWGMLTDLVAFGFNVTYLPFDMNSHDEYCNKLKERKINIVTREQGFNDTLDYVLSEGAQFDYFYFIRVDIAEHLLTAVRSVAPKAKVVFHDPDVFFIRESREAELFNDRNRHLNALFTKERELNIIKRADITVVVSEKEKNILVELLPNARISVFPALYAEVTEETKNFTERKDIFFMGSYAHAPNSDGVKWFANEIWPLVHEKMPDVSFYIIGSNASDEVVKLGSQPGIVYRGYIKDISTIFNTMKLGVAPLRYGAGIKGKVAMTLGAGVPCICTNTAAEGMSLTNGKDTLIEDDPEKFAEALIKVYEDEELWNTFSQNGKGLIKRMFSKESNRRSFLSLLHSEGIIPSETWHDYISKLNKIEDFPILAVPQYENPAVSIVIPVYNQFHYTYKCIDSIITNSGEIKYEIIVANDCSSDQTSRIDEVIKGVVLINNTSNLRFLKNCNNAAKYAKGKYILFLNNDTHVQPNWLAPMVDLIEKDKQIGMVGSKLIYPNGTLQEAGGIMWKDGSAWNYGRGSDPDLPEFNYVKEVDYISGASIMILRSLWEDIGGFDEDFAPSYCEDSDLAFTVRKLGYKVMYQPQSVVVHFEGISNGRDTASGLKAYQIINQKKFFDKWKEVLEKEHFDSGTHVFLARDRSRNKKHVLLIDHYVPEYDKDAGSRTIYHYLKIMSGMGYSVYFIGDNFYRSEPYTTELLQDQICILFGAYYAQKWKEWIVENGKYFEYVFINRPHIAPKYIDVIRNQTAAKIVYNVCDLRFLREEREFNITNDITIKERFEENKNTEISVMKKSDIVFTLSSIEKQIIDSIFHVGKARLCPIFIYNNFERKNISINTRKDLLFVGGFVHTPNIDAVEWFCQEILSIVSKSIPNVNLHIVGSNPPERITSLNNKHLVVHGYVNDEELLSFYDSCRICVIPLRYGAGVKGKTVEAMYNQIPIVSTSIGLEGLEGLPDSINATDSPQEFADMIVTLYNDNDRANKQINECFEYVQNFCSKESAKKIFIEVFPM